MEFNPSNPIAKLCLQGMSMEDQGRHEEANEIFLRAFNESTGDYEKFMSAYYVARHQENVSDRLEWLKSALQYALAVNDDAVSTAFPALYSNIAKCYEDLGDPQNAGKNYELAASSKDNPSGKGPFYHGTKADLRVGDLLTAGGSSNYKADLRMNHIYFTASASGAGLAAALAKGEGPERVYIIEPTGPFEHDPNVTDKKFPGNPTYSYRSEAPLKIVGEVPDWGKQSSEEVQLFREKLANSRGEIIN
jgi:rifampin ADP-ribosylating transferase